MTISSKTTNSKASKSVKVAPKARKTATSTPKAAEPQETITKAKHEAIVSGGSIQINEAVGIHFRAKADSAPIEGDMVLVQVGKDEVPLIVSCTKPLVDGSVLIQAFVTKKSGDHLILGAAKSQTATVFWK